MCTRGVHQNPLPPYYRQEINFAGSNSSERATLSCNSTHCPCSIDLCVGNRFSLQTVALPVALRISPAGSLPLSPAGFPDGSVKFSNPVNFPFSYIVCP